MFFNDLKKKLSKGEKAGEDMQFKPYNPEEDVDVKEETPTEEPKAEAPVKKESNIELKVIRPEAFDEVSTAADALLAGCTVVLNCEALDNVSKIRMLDFLNGVTYCTDGEIKDVSDNGSTFIITPHSNVDISDM